MRRFFLALALTGLAGPSLVRADGMLVPTDRGLPPLALMSERVDVTVDGQVATTTVEQSYRNSTGRDLEAEYLFPLPTGASVREFSMWVGGKRFRGEAVEADRARQTYEDIVRRLEDPGLLEYVGRDLWKMRIYPVPRLGEQKIEIRFTTVLPREGDLVAYRYPLRTGQSPRKTIGDFTVTVRLRSPDPLGSIYSPSHDVAVDRKGEREAVASFERNGCTLDRDFQLYFAPRSKRLGVSLMTWRESPGARGYFLLLLSPRIDSRTRAVHRDVVFVLDTSSSMDVEKMRQARAALLRGVGSIGPEDRFGMIQFAAVPTPFRETLLPPSRVNRDEARVWVESLEARGGTDIGEALLAALRFRTRPDPARAFQVVFITDGVPTVGLTETGAILDEVRRRNGQQARVFTFGVGDDIDSPLLDQLAEMTRGSSTYVRPAEDLEEKVDRLMARISRPVRTDPVLTVARGARLFETYPPRLPDLFEGEQLQVVGRYEGQGPARLVLSGRAGDHEVSESFAVDFPAEATESDFIAPIWAHRKVGYLLDQLRLHGGSAETKRELVNLAREYSIATPYTSLLVIPDARVASRRPPARRRRSFQGPPMASMGMGMSGMGFSGPMTGMGGMGGMGGGMGGMGGGMGGMAGMGGMGGGFPAHSTPARAVEPAATPDAGSAPQTTGPGDRKAAVDLAQRVADLKSGARVEESAAVRVVAGRRFRKIGAAWIDERYKAGAATLKLRVLGAAYFRLLARHPEVKAILALGERVTWVSPSGTALVVDAQGQADVADPALDRLFTATK